MSKHYEQRKEANKRHMDKLDEIKIRPAKGTKAHWAAAAEREGKSLQRFIIDAVEAVAGPFESEK